MTQFSIRLPDDMYEMIKSLAEKERRSLNSQLVKMLEEQTEAAESIRIEGERDE